jgi:glycyl-tRNA synthetase beta chain
MKNILRQATEKDESIGKLVAGEVQVTVSDLKETAEQQLHAETVKLVPQVESFRNQRQYGQALERIASLRPSVDAFFDSVMVMAPEAHLRMNRLRLIAGVLGNFSRIADFSELETGNSQQQ